MIAAAAHVGATAVDGVTVPETLEEPHRQGGFTDLFGHRWSVGDRSPVTDDHSTCGA